VATRAATAGFTDSVVVSVPYTDTGCHRVLAVRGLCLHIQESPAGREAHRACSLTWPDGTHRKTAAAGRTAKLTLIARPLVSAPEWAGHGMAVASIMARADLSHARMAYPIRARIQAR